MITLNLSNTLMISCDILVSVVTIYIVCLLYTAAVSYNVHGMYMTCTLLRRSGSASKNRSVEFKSISNITIFVIISYKREVLCQIWESKQPSPFNSDTSGMLK